MRKFDLYDLPSEEAGANVADTAWIYDMASAIEAHDGERAATFFVEGGRFEAPSIELRVIGRAALAHMFGPGTDAFSTDEHYEVESAVSDGETFAFQWRSRGTRISDGVQFDYRGAGIGRLRDGLIESWTDYFDPVHLGL